jgi:hypothetical protein
MREFNEAAIAQTETDQPLAMLLEDELDMIAGGTPVVNAV